MNLIGGLLLFSSLHSVLRAHISLPNTTPYICAQNWYDLFGCGWDNKGSDDLHVYLAPEDQFFPVCLASNAKRIFGIVQDLSESKAALGIFRKDVKMVRGKAVSFSGYKSLQARLAAFMFCRFGTNDPSQLLGMSVKSDGPDSCQATFYISQGCRSDRCKLVVQAILDRLEMAKDVPMTVQDVNFKLGKEPQKTLTSGGWEIRCNRTGDILAKFYNRQLLEATLRSTSVDMLYNFLLIKEGRFEQLLEHKCLLAWDDYPTGNIRHVTLRLYLDMIENKPANYMKACLNGGLSLIDALYFTKLTETTSAIVPIRDLPKDTLSSLETEKEMAPSHTYLMFRYQFEVEHLMGLSPVAPSSKVYLLKLRNGKELERLPIPSETALLEIGSKKWASSGMPSGKGDEVVLRTELSEAGLKSLVVAFATIPADRAPAALLQVYRLLLSRSDLPWFPHTHSITFVPKGDQFEVGLHYRISSDLKSLNMRRLLMYVLATGTRVLGLGHAIKTLETGVRSNPTFDNGLVADVEAIFASHFSEITTVKTIFERNPAHALIPVSRTSATTPLIKHSSAFFLNSSYTEMMDFQKKDGLFALVSPTSRPSELASMTARVKRTQVPEVLAKLDGFIKNPTEPRLYGVALSFGPETDHVLLSFLTLNTTDNLEFLYLMDLPNSAIDPSADRPWSIVNELDSDVCELAPSPWNFLRLTPDSRVVKGFDNGAEMKHFMHWIDARKLKDISLFIGTAPKIEDEIFVAVTLPAKDLSKFLFDETALADTTRNRTRFDKIFFSPVQEDDAIAVYLRTPEPSDAERLACFYRAALAEISFYSEYNLVEGCNDFTAFLATPEFFVRSAPISKLLVALGDHPIVPGLIHVERSKRGAEPLPYFRVIITNEPSSGCLHSLLALATGHCGGFWKDDVAAVDISLHPKLSALIWYLNKPIDDPGPYAVALAEMAYLNGVLDVHVGYDVSSGIGPLVIGNSWSNPIADHISLLQEAVSVKHGWEIDVSAELSAPIEARPTTASPVPEEKESLPQLTEPLTAPSPTHPDEASLPQTPAQRTALSPINPEEEGSQGVPDEQKIVISRRETTPCFYPRKAPAGILQ